MNRLKTIDVHLMIQKESTDINHQSRTLNETLGEVISVAPSVILDTVWRMTTTHSSVHCIGHNTVDDYNRQ